RLNPMMLGAKAERTRVRTPARMPVRRAATGTPRPRTYHSVAAGLLACGSRPSSCLPEARGLQWRNWDEGSPLTVAGAAPALPLFGAPDSLLALAKDRRREPRRHNNDDYQPVVKWNIKISLYGAIAWQSGNGRKYGGDDGSVKSLVVSQSDQVVQFCAGDRKSTRLNSSH